MFEVSLAGQVGLVTGAGSPHGIGRSLVLSLASAGAKAVYACDINLQSIESLQSIIKKDHPGCVVEGRYLDVSSEEQTVALLREILRKHGRFDFFFANAGFSVYRNLDELSTAHFNRAVAVMQTSVFLATKYGAQAMAATSADKPKGKGSIVVTSSCASLSGSFTDLAYSTVKSACNGLVMSASVHLSKSNIRINAVAPGCTRTSIFTNSEALEAGQVDAVENDKEAINANADEFFKKGGLSGQSSDYYYNRIAEPEEIAHVGVFLASDLASAINGQVILADSGKIAAGPGESFTGPIPPVKGLL